MTKNGAHQSAETTPADEGGEPSRVSPFPIVGIGASAGGLEAFTQLLQHLPGDTGMAFVLIQHLDPKHESKLGNILAKATSMSVTEVTDGLAVEPDHIYVIPKNTTMTITRGVLKLVPRGEARVPHLPVDHFLRSLADDQQSAAIGVILSGTGSDGTLGLAEVKAAGGITFAQERGSAKYDGMPQSAIASGSVDFTLPPDGIARELARIGRHSYLAPQVPDRGTQAVEEEQFRKILTLLRATFGVDFTQYRDTTIRRRTMRRMALHSRESLADYARQLETDRPELQALYQDILINVTSFFRDPAMFEALKESVFPEIIKTKSPQAPIRIWTAGCSTGQEAYSLAIALAEFLDDKPVRPPIQIFATDLSDTVSLERARLGLYPENIEAEVSPERLRRFFTKEDGKYRIIKSIRDLCVFAKHNLASDPPFSRVDLVSCRNVLIYLAPPLQKRVIPTFHYALNPTGFLMLGASESVGAFSDLFGVVDKTHKIYSKKTTTVRQYPHFNAEAYLQTVPGETKSSPQPSPTAADLQKEADRIVLGHYAPAGVLVSESLEILQFRGRTSPYLEPAPGAASLNLLKMAREGLFIELKSAIAEAKRENATAERRGVRIRDGGEVRDINLEVVPVTLHGMSESCFLILFDETGRQTGHEAEGAHRGTRSTGTARVGWGWLKRLVGSSHAAGEPTIGHTSTDERDRELLQLRRELAASREQQQHASEQHDAANEELKSANEEILSSNEELQSTNEELETAKEELQSVNEELTTVNEQLQNRNLELNQSNNDLTNLISSATIPIVMLGSDLRIRRFTPTAGKVLNLVPSDIGRPIGDLSTTVDVPDLEALLEDVIATVQPKERETRDREGRWYQLRLHPYRTADNKIDGAVLVLFDITESRSTQIALKEAGDYTRAIVETVREPLIILDGDLRVRSANESFYETFRVTPEETEDRFIYELGDNQWDISPLKSLLEELLPTGIEFQDFEVTSDFPGIGHRVMLLNARRLLQQNGETSLILLAFEDVTDRKGAEEARARLAAIVESSDDAIIGKDLNGVITSWNAAATRLFGYTAQEAIGQSITMVIPPERLDEEPHILEHIRKGQRIQQYETVRRRKDGTLVDVSLTVSPILNSQGTVVGASKIARDVTERKRAEEALKDADRRKNEFLAMLAHELRNPLAAISNAVELSNRAEVEAGSGEWGKDVIKRQVGNLSHLVSDLMDVSRITQGKIELRKEPVDLESLIARAVAMAQHHIDSRNHDLSISLPKEPVWLDADSMRLEQVFSNLLTNAAKYTEPGGRIELRAKREEKEVVVAVQDSGVGISQDMLPHVFDLFTQAERSSERAQGGLGIGLTVVRSLVAMHGGNVSASSIPGEGSVFTVRLPIGEPPPEKRTERATSGEMENPTSRRILIVDDNADTAQSMALLLRHSGHRVETAHDGPSAIDAARAYRPDVMLLDIGLPGMNGYEIAATLREDECCKDTVIIGLSGYGQENDRRRSREAGFHHHLVKPVDYEALTALLGGA